MENPIIKLQNKISELTDTQRRVADYIIKHPLDVAFLTVDQLAGIVGTSTTTIMRLTFSVGYSGYTEFQKGLQEILRNRAAPQTRLEANIKGMGENNLWGRYAESQISSIQDTMNMISPEVLEETIEKIVSAERIICTSVRSGLPVAQYLTHGLNRLLGNTQMIVSDVSDWVDTIVNMSSNDLVIAISFPRYARRIIDFTETAKGNGVQVISITDSYSSPLMKHSDLILPCNSSSIAFHNSAVSSMFVADYLISAIAINYPERTKERLDKVNKILTNMNYHSLHE
ncbi:MurR/RpiR family transcriptional regulator [Domibacillus sp. DTU_2020_1001157_1_SI_ALB_TIR_016]|uniref:MurR/RpiR family transcriptional regulator n=1 Tax=Domibacillus sp. DTU_2020_1001157_1_SI_ALB_TIR_016 TaxID=3077789 RepID=UPI0028E7888E|nr:MurR/RpiR family transcriptional regulator [Domibacillus sp. DTU_2020_1001157_1_SI_ALB_TIR_016]WNS78623.1 MurR/RpiR family transcriptional regulator [Domibacillus sp. DTU_2020_1001157_1_SI_ALB_TIR_016]